MVRGRKPMPTRLKVLSGAAAKNPQRVNHDEPVAPPGPPTKPRHLDRVASAKWREVVKLLDQMGMLTKADGDLLADYCETHSECRKAKERLDACDPAVDLMAHKRMASEYRAYCDRLAKLRNDLGLTQISRTRLKVSTNAMETLDTMKAKHFG